MQTVQIPLISYTEEIRTLIRTERHDEAFALCQHVLRYYPKHVETYRLAAQAMMERGDKEGAQELFRRVLSADPEDFVAYAGLSIIFEQQRLLDEAAWHLERANELAPANLEIRAELARIYGEIEDHPRARLKLTPGGLARLYLQEGLYPQAIQEFHAIIAGDPNRFDARVALAETLWRNGKVGEAADVALHLLDPLPYCLKANLILGATYHETGLSEAETYLRRAEDLDPHNYIAAELLGSLSPLQPAKAMIPRFSPASVAEAIADRPPIPVAEDFSSDTAADAQTLFEPSTSQEKTSEAPKPAVADAGLPAWLRADFRELAKSSQPLPTTRLTVKPTIGFKSALPPWLTELPIMRAESEAKPAQLSAQKIQEPTEFENLQPPAWLSAQPPAAETTPPALEMPAWLSQPPRTPAAAAPGHEKSEGASVVEKAGAAGEELPHWLRAIRENAAPADQVKAEGTAEEQTPIQLSEILPGMEARAPEPATPEAAPPKQKRKRQPRAYSHLVLAREHRDANRIDQALTEYDYVVQHGPRLIDEAIVDLKELIALWGAPLDAHRVLGDAYTRADRLADALEEYRYVLERVSESP